MWSGTENVSASVVYVPLSLKVLVRSVRLGAVLTAILILVIVKPWHPKMLGVNLVFPFNPFASCFQPLEKETPWVLVLASTMTLGFILKTREAHANMERSRFYLFEFSPYRLRKTVGLRQPPMFFPK